MPDFSFLASLQVPQIYLLGVGWWVGLTVIIMQVQVQTGVNWNMGLPTRTKLGKSDPQNVYSIILFCTIH